MRWRLNASLVMGIALHPYLVGWPHRARHLRRALAHAASLPPGSIVGDVAASPAG